ncbi:hypothetical protein LOTGIDRAFT_133562 [Lottia gigantea]|uniref:Anti-proliferative protein domain-containing protein n=1 Tax=Lottia gigantea TaxID=225164 RepID=V3ZGU5_LOTGI|nr:hypothetical protein LOTGIDRAFT_133562 [Lottia gigantea]ESO83362.1 hypothetical protein LOTGIDRAFT_133562 [Lottia gigantea]
MREEIAAAVVFVKRLVQMNDNLSNSKIDEFSSCLSTILVSRFRNHWYADKPFKGQGYRCIRINPCDPKDDVLEQAAKKCGLKFWDLNMPSEMTLWVDPDEVYCRCVANLLIISNSLC